MGKIISFMNAFKFKKSTPLASDAEEPERDGGDDYAVEKKSTSFYVTSGIVSVLAALLIWLFAVNAGMTEKLFTVQPELRDIEAFTSVAEHSGFTVSVEKDTAVNFALEGRPKVIKNVTNDDIKVFVELHDLISAVEKIPNDKEQTLTAEIIIEAPGYFNIVDVSKEKITIKLVPINKATE